MRDWNGELRKQYYQILDTSILVGYPVFQEQVINQNPSNFYIVIGRVFSNAANTLDKWVGEVFVEVESVGLYGANIGPEVDAMTDQVKQAILAQRATPSQNINGFNWSSLSWDGDTDIPVAEMAGGGYIKRRITRFKQTIVDNN